MKKIFVFIIMIMTVISLSSESNAIIAATTTDDYTVYITVKPYVYSTGFCWYTQLKLKNNITKTYMYIWDKNPANWEKYFTDSDFASDFSLTEGTKETHANSIYWKNWTGEDDYVTAMTWALNAAHKIIAMIQEEGFNCSMSVAKVNFLDNKKAQHYSGEINKIPQSVKWKIESSFANSLSGSSSIPATIIAADEIVLRIDSVTDDGISSGVYGQGISPVANNSGTSFNGYGTYTVYFDNDPEYWIKFTLIP